MGQQFRYSAEFKQAALQELVSGEKRPDQICRERRIDSTTLRRWRLEYEEQGAAAWSGAGAGNAVGRGADRRAGAGHRPADGREPRSQKGCAAGALPVGARHAPVRELSGAASVRALCRILGVDRSWFDRAAGPDPAAADAALRDAIEALVLAFPGYGYRRVTRALQRDGWVVNHKRVLRVMRTESLLCQLKRRWVPTTDSTHGLRPTPTSSRTGSRPA
jgi:transposase-like protein